MYFSGIAAFRLFDVLQFGCAKLFAMLRADVDTEDWRNQLQAFVQKWTSVGRDFFGKGAFDNFVFVERADSWGDFLDWRKSMEENWAFRGHRKAEWSLSPTIDRALLAVAAYGSTVIEFLNEDQNYEESLLFRFRQQAHQYLSHLPDEVDLMSWLALMQHHGAPTRLLDWSLSSYVGAFFAVEEKTEQAAIWAINLSWLEEQDNEILKNDGLPPMPTSESARAMYLNDLLARPELRGPCMIVKVEPYRTDARMTSQRGIFLCKCKRGARFEELVMRMIVRSDVYIPVIRKLIISGAARLSFLCNLKNANVHRGSLFPDLDGFSKSLQSELEFATARTVAGLHRFIEENPHLQG